MKKKGFTLAEVLVTLGIIGVVAALAMPALNSAVQRTKVGPALRKCMNALENANRIVMQEDDVNDLREGTLTTAAKYMDALHKQLASGGKRKIAADVKDGETTLVPKDGEVYSLGSGEELYFKADATGSAVAATNYKGSIYKVTYDMNGFETKPDKRGKDVFYFWVDGNGAVIPVGSKMANKAYNTPASSCTDATKGCNDETAAGAVANANWKVPYKY